MKLDKEYSTCYFKEVKFLSEQGIRYTFVKTIGDVRVYKYEKTKKLFETLAMFYN